MPTACRPSTSVVISSRAPAPCREALLSCLTERKLSLGVQRLPQSLVISDMATPGLDSRSSYGQVSGGGQRRPAGQEVKRWRPGQRRSLGSDVTDGERGLSGAWALSPGDLALCEEPGHGLGKALLHCLSPPWGRVLMPRERGGRAVFRAAETDPGLGRSVPRRDEAASGSPESGCADPRGQRGPPNTSGLSTGAHPLLLVVCFLLAKNGTQIGLNKQKGVVGSRARNRGVSGSWTSGHPSTPHGLPGVKLAWPHRGSHQPSCLRICLPA